VDRIQHSQMNLVPIFCVFFVTSYQPAFNLDKFR